MKMRKIMIQLVILAAVMMMAGGAFASTVTAKLGFIDMQKVLNNSDAGKEAKEQLQQKLKKFQEEINVKQNDLQKLKTDLEKQGVALNETARAAKEKDYQTKLKDFQRFAKDAEEELQAKDGEFTRKILEKLEKLVQEYAKKNGYTAIMDIRTAGLMYLDEKADLTEEILKVLNAQKGTK
jgi:outer membrane protein